MGQKLPFTARLRDFFAKADLCDSTRDKTNRTPLVEILVDRAKKNADLQQGLRHDIPYAARLRKALHEAKTGTLQALVREDVVVCLDQRLSAVRYGLFDEKIMAAAYLAPGGRRVLALRDDGTDPDRRHAALRAHEAETVLDKYVTRILAKGLVAPVLMGTTEHHYGADFFEWHAPGHFSNAMRQKPGLKAPPLRKGARTTPRRRPAGPGDFRTAA